MASKFLEDERSPRYSQTPSDYIDSNWVTNAERKMLGVDGFYTGTQTRQNPRGIGRFVTKKNGNIYEGQGSNMRYIGEAGDCIPDQKRVSESFIGQVV